MIQINVISSGRIDDDPPSYRETNLNDSRILLPSNKESLHRNLKERHMIMIALGGTIGTGLFLASGQALASSGPGGSLISYVLVSIMVYFVMTSLAELSTQYPISGSFNTYGSRFVDEAFGFALAYNYYFSWVTTIAGDPSVVWSLLGMTIMFVLNAFTVKGYAEAEYWFAMIKVLTVVMFIIIGILVDSGVLGHDKIGIPELSTQYPISGSFNTYGTRFVDEAFGFALAYNYYFSWVTTIAGELVAAGIIVQFWLPNSPSVVWSLLGMTIMFVLNAFTVKGYAEAEYWFAMIKVVTVVMFIIVGILVDSGVLGHDKIGIRNWKIDGAPFYKGIGGIITTSIVSGFAFQGTEAVGIAAGESANPRRDVPRAMNGTIWRIILFFVGSIIIMGLVIPYNDPNLAHNDDVKNVAVSPFTLVFIKSGLKPAVHIMNAVILTTILSAGNSGLYVCTRVLYALANEGKAPKKFAYLTRTGIPIWCLVFTTFVSTVLFGLSFIGNKIIYQWLVNITGVMGFIAWFGISLAHWRFRRAFILQGYSLNDLIYKALFFPVGPILASLLICISVLGQGYSAFTTHPFNFSNFLSAYITIPVFLVIYFVYKFVKKTRIVSLSQMDLVTDSIIFRPNERTHSS
ncbi:unnamed protein product [Rotaria sordida]|uniref:Amino acid permease/ SLC12A domain-containing protein n=1 Tax=Rotaria sordida TaxID=392033 RepID=A0A815EMP9_9BILA|nr:unnamed protein product [Rotaria sordida]